MGTPQVIQSVSAGPLLKLPLPASLCVLHQTGPCLGAGLRRDNHRNEKD